MVCQRGAGVASAGKADTHRLCARRQSTVMNPGLLQAAAAFVIWGLMPLYFQRLVTVAPMEVVVHRAVWALVFVLILLAWRGQWDGLRAAMRRPRVIALAAASTAILSLNWLLYVIAVQNGRVVEASLGYFINPLVNVLVGVAVLGERLRRTQWVAVGLAGAGVLWLSWSAGEPPWIALVLAVSFSIYGLLRKTSTLGPLEGLALETMLVAPVALPLLVWWSLTGSTFDGAGAMLLPWLVVLGPLTALPLMLFAAAARRLQLATVGLMQYISPTLQLLAGVLLLGEVFDAQRAVGFALIWSALAVYSGHAWRVHRQARAAA